MSIPKHLRQILALCAALCLAATGAPGVAAQESTPAATAATYPVSIHRGTCPDPIAQPVGPSFDAVVAGRNPNAEFVGTGTQQPVLTGSENYEGTLDALTDTPHTIAIHQGARMYDTIVACGDIAGYVNDGRLTVALHGIDDSTVDGVAVIQKNETLINKALDLVGQSVDFGNKSVDITVYIVPASGDIIGGA